MIGSSSKLFGTFLENQQIQYLGIHISQLSRYDQVFRIKYNYILIILSMVERLMQLMARGHLLVNFRVHIVLGKKNLLGGHCRSICSKLIFQ